MGGYCFIVSFTENHMAGLFSSEIHNRDGFSSSTCFLFYQFCSVTQSCLTLRPLDCSTPASLSITNSQSLLKLMFIESLMPSNHLILCHPLLLPLIFPSIRGFSKESLFTSGGQNIGASASVFPMIIQD